MLFLGHVPSARIPIFIELISVESLIGPLIIIPSHAFLIASVALLSPIIAQFSEAPASITKTHSLPSDLSASSTSELSSKHSMVTIRPENLVFFPKL